MPHSLTLIDPTPDHRFDRNRPEQCEDPDILATRPFSLDPVGPPYPITSLEHWLDLCA